MQHSTDVHIVAPGGAIAFPAGETTPSTAVHNLFDRSPDGPRLATTTTTLRSNANSSDDDPAALVPRRSSTFVPYAPLVRGALAFATQPMRMHRILSSVSPHWRVGLSSTPCMSTTDRVLTCAELKTIAWWEWRLQGRRATLAVDDAAITTHAPLMSSPFDRSDDDSEFEVRSVCGSSTTARGDSPPPPPPPLLAAIPWDSCPLAALHVILRTDSGVDANGRGGLLTERPSDHISSCPARCAKAAISGTTTTTIMVPNPLLDIDVRHVVGPITRARMLETLAITTSSILATPPANAAPSLGTSWSSTYNNCLLPVRHHEQAVGRMRLSVVDIVAAIGSLKAVSIVGAHILGSAGITSTLCPNRDGACGSGGTSPPNDNVVEEHSPSAWLHNTNTANAASASGFDCSIGPSCSSSLIHLRLVDCVLHDDAFLAASLPHLQTAVVLGCSVPRNSLRGVMQASLTRLSVCHSNLRDVAAFCGLVHLTYLNLTGNSDLVDVRPLASLVQLSELYMADCSIRTLAPLAGCTVLWSLDATRNMLDGTGGVERLTSLQRLVLEGCGLTDVAPLAALHQLRYLSLVRNKLLEGRVPRSFTVLWFLEELDLARTHLESLRHFEGFRRLRKLSIPHNRLAHNAFSQHLELLPELRELQAEDCGLDDLRRLPLVCPQLRILHVAKNKQLTDDRMPSFEQVPLLESLNLSGCSLTGMACLKGCRGLKSLDVSENTLSRGAAELADVATVEVLNLGNCGIRDTSFLTSLQHVRQVELRGNVLNFGHFPSYMMHVDAVRSGANVMSPGRKPHRPHQCAAASSSLPMCGAAPCASVGEVGSSCCCGQQHHVHRHGFEDPLSWQSW